MYFRLLFKANLKVMKGIGLQEVQSRLENSPIKTDLISDFQTDLTGLTRIVRQKDGTVGVLTSNGTLKTVESDFNPESSMKKLEEMAFEEVRIQEEVTRVQQAAEVQLQMEAEQQELREQKLQEEKIAIQEENLHRLEEFAKAQNDERSEELLTLFEGNFVTTSLDSLNFISHLDLLQEEVTKQLKIEESDNIQVRDPLHKILFLTERVHGSLLRSICGLAVITMKTKNVGYHLI